MKLRLVDRALVRPNHCAVYHSLGQAHPKGYLATGVMLPGFDNDVYLSIEFMEHAVAFLGWPNPDEHAQAVAERDALRARVEELEREVAEADAFQESLAGVARNGFQIRKKQGRPPSEVTAA